MIKGSDHGAEELMTKTLFRSRQFQGFQCGNCNSRFCQIRRVHWMARAATVKCIDATEGVGGYDVDALDVLKAAG